VKIDPAWNVGIIPLSPAALARRRRRRSRVREYISYSRPRESKGSLPANPSDCVHYNAIRTHATTHLIGALLNMYAIVGKATSLR